MQICDHAGMLACLCVRVRIDGCVRTSLSNAMCMHEMDMNMFYICTMYIHTQCICIYIRTHIHSAFAQTYTYMYSFAYAYTCPYIYIHNIYMHIYICMHGPKPETLLTLLFFAVLGAHWKPCFGRALEHLVREDCILVHV